VARTGFDWRFADHLPESENAERRTHHSDQKPNQRKRCHAHQQGGATDEANQRYLDQVRISLKVTGDFAKA